MSIQTFSAGTGSTPTWFYANTTTTAATTTQFINTYVTSNAIANPAFYVAQDPRLALGTSYEMPDGSTLHLDNMGNYRVEDSSAKVTYRANRVREFNPYINASDLLERFIGDVGDIRGVDQLEILRLPIEAFINWLILKAAQRDGDSVANLPSVESALPPRLALPGPTVRARCETCGRFIRKAWAQARIAFCSPEHMQLRLARIAI